MNWKTQINQGLHKWIKLLRKQGLEDIVQELNQLQEDLKDQTTVMIAGEFKAGKSTFINALLGEEILTSDVTPATAVVTKLTYGQKNKVFAHFKNGKVQEYDLAWLEQLSAERKGKGTEIRGSLSYIELQLPVKRLQSITIIDSPGLNSNYDHHTQATEDFFQRADYVIWLFNYQNVGTATELETLKKLKGYGIKPIGIVNGIDLIDDEDEELEDFLDYSKRRLQGAMDELLGVSALEALEGRLEQDEEKLEWSNWQEVDRLFESFSQDNEHVKKARFFERLKHPMKKLDQYIINQRAELAISRHEKVTQTFLDQDYPNLLRSLHDKEKKLNVLEKEAQKQMQLFSGPVCTLDELRLFMQAFTKKGPMNKEEAKVIIKDWRKHEKFYQSLLINIENFKTMVKEATKKKKEIEDDWVGLKNRKLFKKKQIEELKVGKENYNATVNELTKTNKELVKDHNFLNFKLNKLNHKMMECLALELHEMDEDVELEFEEWNDDLAELQQQYGFYRKKIQETEAFYSYLDETIVAMNMILEDPEGKLLQYSSYKECMHQLGMIDALNQPYRTSEMMNQLTELVKRKPLVHKGFIHSMEHPIQAVSLLPQNLVLPEVLTMDMGQVIDKISIYRFSAAAMLVVFIILGASLGNSSDQEMATEVMESEQTSIMSTTEVSEHVPEVEGSLNASWGHPEGKYKERQMISEAEQEIVMNSSFVQSYFTEYREAYMTALTQDDFSIVKPYLATNSPAYEELDEYLHSVANRGFTFKSTAVEVQGVSEVQNGQALVDVFEAFLFINEKGEKIEYERQKQYTINVNSSNDFDIYQIDIGDTVKNEIKERTVDSATSEDVTYFIQSYYKNFVEAFNGEGFAYINHYYDPDGSEYNATKDYLNFVLEKEMKMRNLSFSITDVKVVSENHYVVRVYVIDQYFYRDGTGDEKEVSADYKVEVTNNGGLLIESMPSLEILSEVEF